MPRCCDTDSSTHNDLIENRKRAAVAVLRDASPEYSSYYPLISHNSAAPRSFVTKRRIQQTVSHRPPGNGGRTVLNNAGERGAHNVPKLQRVLNGAGAIINEQTEGPMYSPRLERINLGVNWTVLLLIPAGETVSDQRTGGSGEPAGNGNAWAPVRGKGSGSVVGIAIVGGVPLN
ncbi:hypothetical protein GWI33_008713 [Rhynchophorus ferrugineus]|uniref:Uncharacterized protein n=1 Tax=Rhynchophorus ferrugineus TaxID=354439 RepID=A0A834MH64_RHYFE|nr:hypothetical protein GWI33_008713 [Rhynchophorus ferrugineus]